MSSSLHSLASYLDLLHDAGLTGHRSDGFLESFGEEGAAVQGITYDSRAVKPGWLFVCKGVHFEERYLQDALQQGACAIVYEQGFLSGDKVAGQKGTVPLSRALGVTEEPSPSVLPIPDHLPSPLPSPYPLFIEVTDLRAALPIIANHFHDRVWERVTTVGITGTKGKSTTTYYVKGILDAWAAAEGRPRTAVLSSIDAYDGVLDHESFITTPEIFELFQHLANAEASGIQHLVMEVSSQGLKYGRTTGVIFDIGCFLNIGEDHISPIEHPDAEDYFCSKLLLFSQCRTAVVNAAMDKAERVMAAARAALPEQCILTFSTAEAVLAGLQSGAIEPLREAGVDGLRFEAFDRSTGEADSFALGMTGTFNVENALAAIAIARALGVPEEHIHQGLFEARVPGRMELFHAPNGAVILIDYAHNWMSFEQLFASVETEYPGTRRTVLFGCPGYKAIGRRYELGTLSGRFCEMTYLTEEDAGEEPVEEICEEIAAFVAAEGGAYTIIPDREEAIHAALEDALADSSGKTVVMLTGKGRETRQKRGQEYVPVTSDLDIVLSFLEGC